MMASAGPAPAGASVAGAAATKDNATHMLSVVDRTLALWRKGVGRDAAASAFPTLAETDRKGLDDKFEDVWAGLAENYKRDVVRLIEAHHLPARWAELERLESLSKSGMAMRLEPAEVAPSDEMRTHAAQVKRAKAEQLELLLAELKARNDAMEEAVVPLVARAKVLAPQLRDRVARFERLRDECTAFAERGAAADAAGGGISTGMGGR